MPRATIVTDIDEIILASEDRMIRLLRASLDNLIEEMQVPVAKGGRMRVKTGFLRNSAAASLVGMPSGPRRGDPNGKYEYNHDRIVAVIAQMVLGDTFYFGWVAIYAEKRNTYDGFMDAALQNWQSIIDRNTAEIKRRILT